MPKIEGWFRARKSLHNRKRVYYEDVYGHKNPEEGLEGVHVLDSESDSEPEISSPKAKRQLYDKTKAMPHSDANPHDKERAMEGVNSSEIATSTIETVIMIDDESDVDESFIADLQRYGMFARNTMLGCR